MTKMARNFRELRAKMSPDSIERSEAKTRRAVDAGREARAEIAAKAAAARWAKKREGGD